MYFPSYKHDVTILTDSLAQLEIAVASENLLFNLLDSVYTR